MTRALARVFAGSKDVPILAPRLLNGPYDWSFLTAPEPGLDGRVMTLNHGRVVGGSSSINSMVYLRGAAADYDEWASAGAVGWSYREVLPYFRRSEDNERGASTYHGAGGPLSVSDGRSRHPLSAAFLRAAQQAGRRQRAGELECRRDVWFHPVSA